MAGALNELKNGVFAVFGGILGEVGDGAVSENGNVGMITPPYPLPEP
jgi:hypothetical protein